MAPEGHVEIQPGLRLHYRWLGRESVSGDDQPPIVVPLATWWGHQLDGLADKHAVLLYDPRGRGRSDPRPESDAGMDGDIEDIERLRLALDLDRISLVGWSYLGAIVARYAARYPQRVHRLVQVGPMVPRREYFPQFIGDYMSRAQQSTPSTSTAAGSVWSPVIAPQLAVPTMASSIIASLDLSSPNEDPAKINAWAAKSMSAGAGWDWRGEAATFHGPVLTIHGVRDNLPVEASREWAQSFPDGRLLLIDHAGHYPHFEQPETFMAAVSTFFDGAWPAGASRS